MDPLNRDRAPFGEAVWQAVDAAAAEAAARLLTARRFLAVEGPFGLGLTSVEAGSDDVAERGEAGEAVAILASAIPVPMLWKGFGLGLRRLAAHDAYGLPLDLTPAAEAAEAVARLEERLVYHGDPRAGVAGLLTVPGAIEMKGGDWASVDRALADVLAAVTALDEAGHGGPYALAASPRLYNGLFRRYEHTDLLQVDHLGRLCAGGIFKAAIPGAVVVDGAAARLLVGQDLMAGFASIDGVHCRLFLSESVVVDIAEPGGLCRISGMEA